LILQLQQGRALLGYQQDAGGFTVQPVHQFEQPGTGPGLAQAVL
jgi:hypothetical protein